MIFIGSVPHHRDPNKNYKFVEGFEYVYCDQCGKDTRRFNGDDLTILLDDNSIPSDVNRSAQEFHEQGCVAIREWSPEYRLRWSLALRAGKEFINGWSRQRVSARFPVEMFDAIVQETNKR